MRYEMHCPYFIVYNTLSRTIVLIPQSGHGELVTWTLLRFFAILIFSWNITSSDASPTLQSKELPRQCHVTLYELSQ